MPRKSTTRGANGGGSIRQRPDGTWEARITLGTDPGTGKPRRKSLYGKTQKEVRQKMQRALVEVDEGSYTEQSRLTVKQWLETWLTDYTDNVKESSRTRYRQDVQNHILPALGAVKLTALTPDMCQKLYNGLSRGEGALSAKSVKNVHGVLHHALKQAVRLGYIRMNPTEACTLPRIEKARIEPLDAPEISRLLDVLGEDVYSDVLRVDLFTGMREGEILGLQWSCVDFDRGTITIEKQLSRPRVKGEEYRFTSLKNDKPRTVQPAPFVMQLLKRQRRRQAENADARAQHARGHGGGGASAGSANQQKIGQIRDHINGMNQHHRGHNLPHIVGCCPQHADAVNAQVPAFHSKRHHGQAQHPTAQ